MNKLTQMWRLVTHPQALRMTLSGLGTRLGGNEAMGGLTSEETSGLLKWVRESGCARFIEIGTLFGFTAKTIARETDVKVTAVDIFCWNPFGLTSEQHELFTRRILENELQAGSVELVKTDSRQFLQTVTADDFVFLDGDHRYESVKAELEIVKERGVRWIAGHDFGNPNFGVTQAVREVVGDPDETAGMCWLKRMN